MYMLCVKSQLFFQIGNIKKIEPKKQVKDKIYKNIFLL